MNIIKTSTVVKEILIRTPACRDSDEKLILNVWAKQEPKLANENFSFVRFSKLFKEGKLANTESIRRSRQKIQQEIPSLRGENYKERNNHQEDVKDQLKDLSMISGGTP